MREKYTNISELKRKMEELAKILCQKAVEHGLDVRRLTSSQISLLLEIPLMSARYLRDYIMLYNYKCEESGK